MSSPGQPTFDESGIVPYVESNALTFYWIPPSGATPDSYILSSFQDLNSPYTIPFTSTVYTVNGLINGQLYTYDIRASKAGVLSPPSVYATVQPSIPPNPPINIQVSTINSSSALVSWTRASVRDSSLIRGYCINGIPEGQIVNLETLPLPTSTTGISVEPFRQNVNIFYNNRPSSLLVQAVTDGGYSTEAYAPFIKNDYITHF